MATITVTLNDEGARTTPLNIGTALAEALSFGTDDPMYYYDDEPYTLDLTVHGHVVGTVTLS